EATAGEARKEGQALYSQFSGYERIAALLLQALHSDSTSTIPLTVRNQCALEDLDANDAVELPCEVSSSGINPRKVRRAPEVVRALLLQVKEYERLTVRACVDRSSEAALSALLKNPLVGERDVARAVLSDYVEAFGDQMHLASSPS